MPLRIFDLFPEREITITFSKNIFNSGPILSHFLGISLIFITESLRFP